MQLVNLTPLNAERFCLIDSEGADMLVVVVKGTYRMNASGKLVISDEQRPVIMADEYVGEPGKSSVQYASEVCLSKTGTDVALVGHAVGLDAQATQVDVSLQLGPVQKTVRVFGDRQWKKSWGFLRMTPPQPFERMELVYERSFGGVDESPAKGSESEPANPVGVGFRAKKSEREIAGARLPNLEDPLKLISSPGSHPSPTGFGFIAPNWQPRARYSGTYDENWQRDRMPLLPTDFNPRFNSAAAVGLFCEGFLRGNERGQVVNAGRHGTWTFELPAHRLEFVVDLPEAFEIVSMDLDTVLVEADKRELCLTWRGELNVHGKLYDIGWVKTQFVGGAS